MYTKWILSLFVVASIVMLGIAMTGSARTEERPPDIALHLWHPLSETSGIALSEKSTMTGTTELRGTLMIRQGKQWRAVYLERDDATAVPAK